MQLGNTWLCLLLWESMHLLIHLWGLWGQDGGEPSSISLGEHLCRTTFLCVLRCLRASRSTISLSLIVCHHSLPHQPPLLLFFFCFLFLVPFFLLPPHPCICQLHHPQIHLSLLFTSAGPHPSHHSLLHFCPRKRLPPQNKKICVPSDTQRPTAAQVCGLSACSSLPASLCLFLLISPSYHPCLMVDHGDED